MEQYAQMKDSGVTWIQDIPTTWGIRVLFQLADQVKNKNKDLAEKNLLSLSYGRIKRKNIDSPEGLLPESFDGYNIIEADDIVLRLTDLQNDHTSLRVGQAKERGIITSAYTTLRPSGLVNPRFLYYVIHAYDLIKGFYGMGAGVRQGLNYDEVKTIKVPFPSLEIQNGIVAFLDDQVSQIDSIIEETKNTIEEYKSWKKSIIHEAVTRGITHGIPMKATDSLVSGEIPRHWEIKRFKNIASEMYKGSGITKEDIYDDGDVSCVRYGEIYTKYDTCFDDCFTKTMSESISSKRYFTTNDILFAGTGELVEEIGKNIVYLGNDTCLAGGDIIVAKHHENPVFLSYALNSHYAQTQKSEGKAKLKVVHISVSEIGNLTVFLPPAEEQNAIADFLSEQCSLIGSAISEKNDLIADLEKYKRSIIYDVVTGKRKVV